MIDYLPPSLRGLMVAAFAAAYMSTIGTQLNWGASYLVNDFYRRLSVKGEPSATMCAPRRSATMFLLTLDFRCDHLYMDSIGGAWKLLIVTGAGTGAVLYAALVLVAHQRVERSLGHGRRVRRFLHAADGVSISTATTRWISRTSF